MDTFLADKSKLDDIAVQLHTRLSEIRAVDLQRNPGVCVCVCPTLCSLSRRRSARHRTRVSHGGVDACATA